MGAVIGGAIGSVVGASIAPKKGKKTREEVVETAKNAKKNSKRLIAKAKKFFSRKKRGVKHESKGEVRKIPTEEVENKRSWLAKRN